MCRRTVMRCIDALAVAGLLDVAPAERGTRQSYHTREWGQKVTGDKTAPVTKVVHQWGQKVTTTGDKSSPLVVTDVAHTQKDLRRNSEEASESRARAREATTVPEVSTWQLVSSGFSRWRIGQGGRGWVPSHQTHRHVGAIAEWVDAEAERTGRDRKRVLRDLLAAYAEDEWAARRGWPIGALAADPGARMAAAGPSEPRGLMLADERRREEVEVEMARDEERSREAKRRARSGGAAEPVALADLMDAILGGRDV